MKTYRILLILSVILITLGLACIVVGSVLTLSGNQTTGDLFLGVSSILGVAALVVLILRLLIMAKTPQLYSDQNTKVVVKVVDVKEVPRTKEEKLYEQYEDLYKQNLITKEDLDKKRVELLGK